MSTPHPIAIASDQTAIDLLFQDFFGAFDNRDGVRPDLDRLRRLFLPEGLIIKNSGSSPEVYTVEGFIAPRVRMLTDGTLTGFQEAEMQARTEIFGNVAQRIGIYRKSGVLSGQPFQARGMKTAQLVRTAAGWRISALAWDDERDGFQVPEHL